MNLVRRTDTWNRGCACVARALLPVQTAQNSPHHDAGPHGRFFKRRTARLGFENVYLANETLPFVASHALHRVFAAERRATATD
jgi:hypothetical protein